MASKSTGSSRTPSDDATREMGAVTDDSSDEASSDSKGAAAKGGASTTADKAEKSSTKGGSKSGQSSSRTPAKSGGAAAAKKGPRRVRLTLARLDPFSVMKLSFLIAIGIGIATVVAVAVLWGVVDAIGLWDKVDQLGRDFNRGEPLPFMELFEFRKMLSYGTVVAFANLVLITALGTLFAFLYNIVAALLGGLKITFTDS